MTILLVVLGILLWYGQGAHVAATNKLCGAKQQSLAFIWIAVTLWPLVLIVNGILFIVGTLLAAMGV